MFSRAVISVQFRKRVKETQFEHRFRLATLIMSTAPWSRMPLTLRWLKPVRCCFWLLVRQLTTFMQFYKLPHPQNTQSIPEHMTVTEGPPEEVCMAPTADYSALARQLDGSPPCTQCGRTVTTTDMLVACVTCVKLSHWRCAADVAHSNTDNGRQKDVGIYFTVRSFQKMYRFYENQTRSCRARYVAFATNGTHLCAVRALWSD